ncbi:MAG: M48 family metallopeptidase [Candidatus Gastranaerophilales bacterium]|nr:M48 family metallopeptidase [Candidatus Gastranaerophilales bacterium]
MKKNLLIIAALLLMCLSAPPSFGIEIDVIDITKEKQYVDTLNRVGFRLLNANGLTNRAIFRYDPKRVANAYALTHIRTDRRVVVYRGALMLCDSDDELAGVLGHEISHIMDSYDGILRGSFDILKYVLTPRKYEYKADKRSIDYMVKAGYNPVAYIVLMTKLMGQFRYDTIFSGHPLTTRRTAEVYEYIYKKYPYFLAENAYKDNIYYQNFLLTSSENRRRLQKNIQSGSNKKTNYK